ncbi:MAG: type II secretion system F family protein [Victivallales bacterium]|jgi:type II secretory pathway component PulF|nr:type II secretion system F family protein [Victivallales bacterium]MBT7300817.1 type II secretion system F family protein [Victivallales bacterium]
MTMYRYNAITRSGRPVTGTIDAEALEEAGQLLLGRGLTPIELGAASNPLHLPNLGKIWAASRPIRSRDLILFTKQFSTMLKAGMSVMRLLQVLEEQTENSKLRRVTHDILDRVQQGESLHGAFAEHPKVFPALYYNMISAGEASGALPQVLERLTQILQHEEKVKSDVSAACRYPLIVVVMLGLAFFVLLTFVIPKFATLFEKGGIELPLPTRICMGLHHLLRDNGAVLLVLLVAVVAGLTFALRTDTGRFLRDRLLLHIPVLGSLFIKAAMSRFASIFAILQASGVSALDALVILRNTIGNEAIAREFDQVSDQLVEGRGIAAPLRSARYFPPMVVNMTAVGEESGALDDLLSEVAEHYDVEVQYATKGLSDALAPLLTVGLAAVVGFFALAIFLPMWDLYKITQ